MSNEEEPNYDNDKFEDHTYEQPNNEHVTNIQDNTINTKQKELEENTIWNLEIWKRAEQTKFKAYLKQLEYEFLNKIAEEFRLKEEEREKEIKSKVNELTSLQTRLKKKASELETRENKLSLMEEELKIKINEVARQLANKEDEINYIKKRFKDEKTHLEKEKQNFLKQLEDKSKEIELIEKNFRNFKKEMDDSPLSLIKNELSRKNMEFEEMIKENDRTKNERDKYKQNCERLKLDLIKMKKHFDSEKEAMYKQKIDEIEKLKFEIYNQKMSSNEIAELQDLRNKIKQMTQINEEKKVPEVTKKKEYILAIGNKKTNSIDKNNHIGRSEIDKLTVERDKLLSTGMYTENDKLIIQLDNRIKNLIENQY